MKKILYVTTVSRTLNAFLIPHIEKLVYEGYKVDCACAIDLKVDDRILSKGCNIFDIPFSRNPANPRNVKAFRELLKIQERNEYDILHVHTPVASFVTRLAFREKENLKIIYTCHGFHFYKGSSIVNWILFYPLEKLAARWTDTLVTINEEDYKMATTFKLRNNGQVIKMNGVGIEKEKYIIENFNKNEYRKKLNLEENDFVILVLAELNNNKNHNQLIKAMNLLKDKYPNIKAIFAGSGPLEEDIKYQIKENGLENKISLIGWRNDVKELINSCDMVGLFSKREGFGKCLLEAIICGKPVIATNTRGPRELIKENVNGFLVEINDIEQTANYIEKIYMDNKGIQKLEEKISEKGNKYLLVNVLNQLNSIYNESEIYESRINKGFSQTGDL